MPKSRNKRKNSGKKRSRPAAGRSSAAIQIETGTPASSAAHPRRRDSLLCRLFKRPAFRSQKREPGRRPAERKQQFTLPFSKTKISAPRPGYAVFVFTLVIPLFAGSTIGSGGLPLRHMTEFIILTVITAIANWSSVYLCSPEGGPERVRHWAANRWLVVSGMIQLALIILFVQFTSQLGFSDSGRTDPGAIALLAGCALALSWPIFRLCSRVEDVLFDLAMILFASSALGMVAVYAQSGRLMPVTAVLGMISGALLAASKVAENSQIFEQEGWRRANEAVNKKGLTVIRPGGLTRLFSALLVLVPAVTVVVVPLGFLPPYFLLIIPVLIAGANVAQRFLLQSRSDQETAKLTRYAALGGGIAAGLAGWLA